MAFEDSGSLGAFWLDLRRFGAGARREWLFCLRDCWQLNCENSASARHLPSLGLWLHRHALSCRHGHVVEAVRGGDKRRACSIRWQLLLIGLWDVI